MTGTRILVTGGAGFIGSHYVRTLLGPHGDPHVHLTVLDKLTYAGTLTNLAPVRHNNRFTFVHGDITDTTHMHQLLANHDQVVHFAAESHVDRSIHNPNTFLHTNILGTHTLLQAALHHGTKTFIHVSTDEVYGSITNGSSPETHPLNPSSPYSATKASSDLIALAYHHTHGLDIRITRCSNNYGPYQHPEKLIPLFITNLLQGLPVPLYGNGSNTRDWLHVDDHIRAIELVRTKGQPGHIYNIGGGTQLTNKQLTHLLLKACNAQWNNVTYTTDRKGHDQRYSLDYTKITQELGYQPQHNLTHALTETVTWYRTHPTWWQPLHPHQHPTPTQPQTNPAPER